MLRVMESFSRRRRLNEYDEVWENNVLQLGQKAAVSGRMVENVVMRSNSLLIYLKDSSKKCYRYDSISISINDLRLTLNDDVYNLSLLSEGKVEEVKSRLEPLMQTTLLLSASVVASGFFGDASNCLNVAFYEKTQSVVVFDATKGQIIARCALDEVTLLGNGSLGFTLLVDELSIHLESNDSLSRMFHLVHSKPSQHKANEAASNNSRSIRGYLVNGVDDGYYVKVVFSLDSQQKVEVFHEWKQVRLFSCALSDFVALCSGSDRDSFDLFMDRFIVLIQFKREDFLMKLFHLPKFGTAAAAAVPVVSSSSSSCCGKENATPPSTPKSASKNRRREWKTVGLSTRTSRTSRLQREQEMKTTGANASICPLATYAPLTDALYAASCKASCEAVIDELSNEERSKPGVTLSAVANLYDISAISRRELWLAACNAHNPVFVPMFHKCLQGEVTDFDINMLKNDIAREIGEWEFNAPEGICGSSAGILLNRTCNILRAYKSMQDLKFAICRRLVGLACIISLHAHSDAEAFRLLVLFLRPFEKLLNGGMMGMIRRVVQPPRPQGLGHYNQYSINWIFHNIDDGCVEIGLPLSYLLSGMLSSFFCGGGFSVSASCQLLDLMFVFGSSGLIYSVVTILRMNADRIGQYQSHSSKRHSSMHQDDLANLFRQTIPLLAHSRMDWFADAISQLKTAWKPNR